MFWILFTVICYTISSLGDKYISANLEFNEKEFTFIVAGSTALWLGGLLPFVGFYVKCNVHTLVVILLLFLVKLLEFYTSAKLLKMVSAYELKAWLGSNIILSYFYNVFFEKELWKVEMLFLSIFLIVGIAMILKEKKEVMDLLLYILGFVMSKLFYGILIGQVIGLNEKISILFILMLLLAFSHLPFVSMKKIFSTAGVMKGALTRIPNAAGLIFESMAATENLYLYAMIQPIQLLILFCVSLVRRENIGKWKFFGSIICILCIFVMTILQKL